MGPMGPQGEKGEPGEGMWWFVKEYTIRPNQWELVGGANNLESYYRYEINISELDEDIFYDGKVSCSVYTDEESKNIQQDLPCVWHYGEPDNDGPYLWTETYDFDYAVGSIMLYVTYNDFLTAGNLPDRSKFRVILNY
jgi:hypothetical protein